MPKDKDEQIAQLKQLLDGYDKITRLSNQELMEAQRSLDAHEKISEMARDELSRAMRSLEKLQGDGSEVREQIIHILSDNDPDEDLILHEIDHLSESNDKELFADLFNVIANLDISEKEAISYWNEIKNHTLEMSEKLGRKVSFRVALLDHLMTKNRKIKNPKIIELNLFDAVIKNSIIDELTGIYNRRYFNSSFRREIKRATRYNRRICFFSFDADNFKRVNDVYGHNIGDEMLKIIGNTMIQVFRQEDFNYRLGGEEFGVVLPEIDMNSALVATKRFAAKLKENIKTRLDIDSSISGGISEFPIDGTTLEDLYLNADKALYKVKNSGKNNIISCRDTE